MTGRMLGSILLIAGTCVGAGMLALPVVTALEGFLPNIMLFFAVWVLMVFTGLLVLEVALWIDGDTNIISMARTTLGKPGAGVAWVTFLLLLYAITTAYVSGGAALLAHAFESTTLLAFLAPYSIYIFAGIFAYFIYYGTAAVDYVNRLAVLGFVISYIVMVVLIAPHVNMGKLTSCVQNYSLMAIPVIVTALTYHIIVPSLKTYLNNNVVMLRRSIIIGSFIPFFIYCIWELIVLGVIPLTGTGGLIEMHASGQPSAALTHAFDSILNSTWISTATAAFSLFALVTSLLGASLSLADFLADGFKIRKTALGRLILVAAVFVPTVILSILFPRSFIIALGYAGACVVILYGILPVLMVWNGRYRCKIARGYQAPGGRATLILVFLASVAVLGIEFNFLPWTLYHMKEFMLVVFA